MKPTEELHHLIKSLTRNEKGYFKKYSGVHVRGEENVYSFIFDHIDKQKNYDESALKEAIAKNGFEINFAIAKNQLNNLILKTLRSYYDEKSSQRHLRDLISDIEFLYSKALYKNCRKLIQKGKTIAQKTQNHYYLIQLIRWEKSTLHTFFDQKTTETTLQQLEQELATALNNLEKSIHAESIWDREYIQLFYRESSEIKKQEQPAFLEEDLKHPDPTDSIEVKITKENILGLRCFKKADHENGLKHLKTIIELFENNDYLIYNRPGAYVNTIYNLASTSLMANNFPMATQAIKFARDSHEKYACLKDEEVKIKNFLITETLEHLLLVKKQEFTELRKKLDQTDYNIENFREKSQLRLRLEFMMSASICYFILGEFKKSLSVFNEILAEPYETYTLEFTCFLKLFEVLLHLELEHYDLVEYLHKSNHKFFKEKAPNTLYHESFFRYIKEMLKIPDRAKAAGLRNELIGQIHEITKKDPSKIPMTFLFNIEIYLASKNDGKTMAEHLSSKTI